MKTIQFEGQTHQFPDDFSDSDISAALASAPPATQSLNPPAEEAPVTAGGLYNAVDVGAAKAAAGMAGLPKVISDLGAQGIQAATNWTANKLGHPEWQDTRDLSKPGLIKLPTSEEAMTAIQRDMASALVSSCPTHWLREALLLEPPASLRRRLPVRPQKKQVAGLWRRL